MTLPNRSKTNTDALANQILKSYDLGLKYKEVNHQEAIKFFTDAIKPIISKKERDDIENKLSNNLKIQQVILDSMSQLGKIYLMPGFSSEAAAIFQYCDKFSKKYPETTNENFLLQAYQAEVNFLKNLGKETEISLVKEQTEKYKTTLLELRSSVITELKNINDISDISTRALKVEKLYEKCNQFFVQSLNKPALEGQKDSGFLQDLLNDCMNSLGNPPCEYTIIGLGSLSGGTMTPYSDLEFAILIKENNEEYKKYFTDLTNLLKIKVTNLGETPIHLADIEGLNNQKTANPEDDWFWDHDIVDGGYNWDAPCPQGCKTPLGRKGYIGHKDYELICTPADMLKYQQGNEWLESDPFLVHTLRHLVFVNGSKGLFNEYREGLCDKDNAPFIKERVLNMLETDIVKYGVKVELKDSGKLYNVKQDLYRIVDKTIDLLFDYYGITPILEESGITVWQKIQRMKDCGIISELGAQHLTEAISIVAELRLETYFHSHSRLEKLSTYKPYTGHLSAKQQKEWSEKTLYVQDTNILHHLHYIMLELQKTISDYCVRKNPEVVENMDLSKSDLFNDSDYTKALVHANFLEYDKALEFMQKAKGDLKHDRDFLDNLYYLYYNEGDIKGLLITASEINLLKEEKYSQDTRYMANSLFKSAVAEIKAGNNSEADEHFKLFTERNFVKTLDIFNTKPVGLQDYIIWLIDHSLNNPFIPQLSLSSQHSSFGYISILDKNYEKAFCHLDQALKIKMIKYTKIPNHPEIASSYSALASLMYITGNYNDAETYAKNALEIQKVVYKNVRNHAEIADSYTLCGKIHFILENYGQAIEYFKSTYIILWDPEEDNWYNNEQKLENLSWLEKAQTAGGCLNEFSEELERAKISINVDAQLIKYQARFVSAIENRDPIENISKIIADYEDAAGFNNKNLDEDFLNWTVRSIIATPVPQHQGETPIQIAGKDPEIVDNFINAHGADFP